MPKKKTTKKKTAAKKTATAKRKTTLRQAAKALKKHALSLPEAYEDHPWGESVAKVRKKVFVFFGHGESDHLGFSVKLPESLEAALHLPFTEPTGYGLGKAGWVSVDFRKGAPPLDIFKDWIEESYCAVAPKKLAAQLQNNRD